MRLHEIFAGTYERYGTKFKLYQNPSNEEFDRLLTRDGLRAFLDADGTLWCWDPAEAIHYAAYMATGIEPFYELELFPDYISAPADADPAAIAETPSIRRAYGSWPFRVYCERRGKTVQQLAATPVRF